MNHQVVTLAEEAALQQILEAVQSQKIHHWSFELSGTVAYIIGRLSHHKPSVAGYYHVRFIQAGILADRGEDK
jgi:hypothetical protein